MVLADLNELTDVQGIGLTSAHQLCEKILKEVNYKVIEDKPKISAVVTPTLPHTIKQVGKHYCI